MYVILSLYVAHKTAQMQSEICAQLISECIRMHNLCNGMTSCISTSKRLLEEKPRANLLAWLVCSYLFIKVQTGQKKIELYLAFHAL